MSKVRALSIRGCQKVIDHYRKLLDRADSEAEREIYRERIEREQRTLAELTSEPSDSSVV